MKTLKYEIEKSWKQQIESELVGKMQNQFTGSREEIIYRQGIQTGIRELLNTLALHDFIKRG